MKTKQDQHTHDFKAALRKAANKGRGEDTELIHASKDEERLLKAHGGSGKTNPATGLKEYDREMSHEGRSAGPGNAGGAGRGSAGGTNRNNGLSDQDILSNKNWNAPGPDKPTITRSNEGRVVGEDTDSNHQEYQPGDVPSVPNASLGQVIGTMLGNLLGMAVPGAGVVNSAPDIADGVENGNAGNIGTGGFIGRAVDDVLGGTPAKMASGWSNPDPNAVGRQRRNDGNIQPVTSAARGRVNDEANGEPDLAGTLTQVLSAPGVWPPVRASRGV